MPTLEQNEIEVWAHCAPIPNQPPCPGYTPERVRGIKRTWSWTYKERGGDMPGVEATRDELVFADEDDAVCPSCANPDQRRILSEQPRRTYQPAPGVIHDAQAAPAVDPRDAVIAEMRERLAALESAA